jgi:hypothetical protein
LLGTRSGWGRRAGASVVRRGCGATLTVASDIDGVLAGEYIVLRAMPGGVVAGGLDVEAVVEHERAAVGGSDGDEHGGDQAEDQDGNRWMSRGVILGPAQTQVDGEPGWAGCRRSLGAP